MKTKCDFVSNLKNANSKMSRSARFQGSHTFLQTETTNYLRLYLLLKLDWCSHRFCILKRFEFFLLFVLISFYSDVILNILFFGGIAGQIHILF